MNIIFEYPTLKNNMLFKNAEDANISKYVSDERCSICEFSAGDEIISHDLKNVPVGFVLEGTATITSADGGKKVLLKTIGGGAVFGISTLYAAESPFPTNIKAKSACRILFIESRAIRELIENDKGAMIGFISFLSDRVVYLNKKINAFTAGCAERRLSLFLAENETDGVYSSSVSISSLADMLDIGRASLYRAFDKLEAEGFIEKHEKIIVIKNKKEMLSKYFGQNI